MKFTFNKFLDSIGDNFFFPKCKSEVIHSYPRLVIFLFFPPVKIEKKEEKKLIVKYFRICYRILISSLSGFGIPLLYFIPWQRCFACLRRIHSRPYFPSRSLSVFRTLYPRPRSIPGFSPSVSLHLLFVSERYIFLPARCRWRHIIFLNLIFFFIQRDCSV